MSSHHPFWTTFTKKYASALDPLSRLSEVVFGLIMVLTFTCSIGAATAGREEIRTMLWGALGCNTAWGIVDAFMILMAALFTRGQGIRVLQSLHKAPSLEEANLLVRSSLPPAISEVIKPEHVEALRISLLKLPEPPHRAFFTGQDFKDAALVFLLVFISTFPVALPFILIREPLIALRVSNGIALLLLFTAGISLGKQTGYKPFRMGIIFALTGAALVSLTMALGG